ncbi:MAG: hypothetical protein KAR40_09610 [Candidatus Sabulitectum sp.]|nr:hypothetical protein [Candidatus Sabulitectum sp.]
MNISPELQKTLDENDYEAQGREFLKMTGVTFKAEFLEHGKHFDNDTDTRDIYQITLTKGGRSYSFKYGQSANASGEYKINLNLKREVNGYTAYQGLRGQKECRKARMAFSSWGKDVVIKNKDFSEPTPYSVLACITKHDPETFEDFCSNFGYDTDSRSAEKTYKAVSDEYKSLQTLFTEEELEVMSEIQ